MIYIGLDDTDVLGSRGTGRLARAIAAGLSAEFTVRGVVRHQLLQDPRVPFTSHNSSATIMLEESGPTDLDALFKEIKRMMLDDFIPGSDPGLCVVRDVPSAVAEHGWNAKKMLVTQNDARGIARSHGIALEGLGGTEDGIIGALASVGLTSCGDDGRYLHIGRVRELQGLLPVEEVLAAGVREIRTLTEERVTSGLVMSDKIRPARKGGEPIAYVAWKDEYWMPLKLG
ncbi:MAG TPA: ABC transporter substrate-binding protein [Spirochaetota bacterium]|nr:ABC transporter substrate-binding protein [Spirochaetota bacterium]HPI89703.1 ABC transporter substrate-binding protein [Spirochaetota bacterium]HPR48338.1 ABC transporter substrate-binding protein [Spirochaetota bacterium]